MKLGILQTGHSPEDLYGDFGDYDAMFRDLLDGNGFEFQTWAVVDGIFPDGPEAADGWLITGSKHGAYENHPWIAPLEEFIRAVYAGRPVLRDNLAAAAAVERNAIVRAVYNQNGLSIEIEARALERGATGDIIRAMNLSSRATILAEVQENGHLKVLP